MEYPRGRIARAAAQGRPAAETADVLRWLEQAAAALDAGHAAGVVHRDVKPGNLLLDGRGEVHVADFGVASAVGLDSLTMTGTVLGTAGYLAPEQARATRGPVRERPVRLAVVAWELLTGRRPFESDSPTAEAAAHVERARAGDLRASGLPPELDPVFKRALAKDPAARYGSAADFVAALRGALGGPPGNAGRLAAGRGRAQGPPKRSRGVLVGGLLLGAFALLGGGLAMAEVFAGGDEPETRTVVQVRTEQGEVTTVRETQTVRQPTPPPPTPPPPTPGQQQQERNPADRRGDQAARPGALERGRGRRPPGGGEARTARASSTRRTPTTTSAGRWSNRTAAAKRSPTWRSQSRSKAAGARSRAARARCELAEPGRVLLLVVLAVLAAT